MVLRLRLAGPAQGAHRPCLAFITILALVLVPTRYLLWHTRFGLRLRSVGEARPRPTPSGCRCTG